MCQEKAKLRCNLFMEGLSIETKYFVKIVWKFILITKRRIWKKEIQFSNINFKKEKLYYSEIKI